jgi:CelD/BcsL family acetyltransferase involved in cellulose biosynthesis
MHYRSSYHGMPIRLLSLITNDHTNRADFILADRQDECLAAILGFLRAEAAGWDMAELNFLPADSPTVAPLRERAGDFGLTCETKPSYESPFIPLTGDWEKFYARLDGHFRRNMRNREKRLAGLGPVEYEESQEGVRPVGVLLDEIFDVGERSWKGTERTAVASTPELRRFYARLAEFTHPTGGLSLHLLRVGGKPIAFHYSLKSDRAVYLLKTEYDTAYHPYSPGHQIQKRVLERCYADDVRQFDFLGPVMGWKREWSDRVRPHVRMLLFHRGARSRVLAVLERRVKPALKRSRLLQRVRAHDIQD